jgi:hypothetical protein
MAEYLSPEVYIEEIPSGLQPIQGVGTSTAAFVGLCQKGPFGEAVPITQFAQFVKIFGSYIDGAYLAFAVRAFFTEGGTSCYVVRTCHYAVPSPAAPGTPKSPTAVAAAQTFPNTTAPSSNVLRLTANSKGAWGNDLSVSLRTINAGAGDRFLLELRDNGNVVEIYDGLTMDKGSADYAVTRLAGSAYVMAEDLVLANSPLTPAQRL